MKGRGDGGLKSKVGQIDRMKGNKKEGRERTDGRIYEGGETGLRVREGRADGSWKGEEERWKGRMDVKMEEKGKDR